MLTTAECPLRGPDTIVSPAFGGTRQTSLQPLSSLAVALVGPIWSPPCSRSVAMTSALRVLRAGRPRRAQSDSALAHRAARRAGRYAVPASPRCHAHPLLVEVLGAESSAASVRGSMSPCVFSLAEDPWGFRISRLALVTTVASRARVARGCKPRGPSRCTPRSRIALRQFGSSARAAGRAARVRNLGGARALRARPRLPRGPRRAARRGSRERASFLALSQAASRTPAVGLFAGFASPHPSAIALALARVGPVRRRARASRGELGDRGARFVPRSSAYVAPRVRSPVHLCLVCLLDADGSYLGWPLYARSSAATSSRRRCPGSGANLDYAAFATRGRVDDRLRVPSPHGVAWALAAVAGRACMPSAHFRVTPRRIDALRVASPAWGNTNAGRSPVVGSHLLSRPPASSPTLGRCLVVQVRGDLRWARASRAYPERD